MLRAPSQARSNSHNLKITVKDTPVNYVQYAQCDDISVTHYGPKAIYFSSMQGEKKKPNCKSVIEVCAK
jgi:hypothetical protein